MPLPLSNPQPPQTAADLLEGLLRSQLFAESIFGQILEQSSGFLEYPAGEFAAVLVQKKVLTPWQASELLAGRTSVYAGTFRLLERIETGIGFTLFTAEQSGPQRLVWLHLSATTPASTPPNTWQLSHEQKTPLHLVKCIEVQQTASLRLVAYEFTEAQPLTALLVQQSLEKRHAADLLRQFARAIEGVSDLALDTVGLESALVDSRGQLTLLAEPSRRTVAENLSLDPKRVDREMAAANRFAAALGCLSEIAGCRSPGEVHHFLSEFSEPWLEAYAPESVRCPRAHLNRFLRKGPALRAVEEFSRGQQVEFIGLGASEGMGIEESRALKDSRASRPLPLRKQSSSKAEYKSAKGTQQTASGDHTLPQPKRRVRSWMRFLVFAAGVCMIVTGIVATQWFMQWNTRRAGAASETQTERAAKPPGSVR